MKPIYRLGHTAFKIIGKLFFKYRVIGRENLIETGPAILASNHVSFFDPPCIGMACRREVYYLAKDTLFTIPVLGWLIARVNTVPVDRTRGDLTALKTFIRLVRAGHRVVIFPEGTRSVDGSLQPARPGLGMVIAKTLAPVIPCRIFGTYEVLPKSGGLRLHPITVVIGKPMHFRPADVADADRNRYQELSDQVMEAIAGLKPG
jgi:1-acyl-sn-glycerol-3-phosphate acyltransferase